MDPLPDSQTVVKDPGNSLKVAVTTALFLWNPVKRLYQDIKTGKYLTPQEVRIAVDQVIDGYQAALVTISTKLQVGEITLAEWQLQMARMVKDLHVATAVAANGGFANMSQADYGFVGSEVKKQYQFLQGFADDIVSGKQLVKSGSLVARARLYAQAARTSYEQTARRREKRAGEIQERRVLGSADHCPDCVALAAKGWQPIGTLPAIGQGTVCLANCRCSFDFQVSDKGV
jgi:hypothetical protein